MDEHTKISYDLIKEMLLDVFRKDTSLNKPNPVIRYDRDYLLSTRPKPLSEPINHLPHKSEDRNINFRRRFHKEKIKTKCNFCGELGHIKRTCSKNRAFRNPISIPSPQLDYEPKFLKVVKFLDLLQVQPISIAELRQLRTIIDTLIYFHPTSYNQHCKPPL